MMENKYKCEKWTLEGYGYMHRVMNNEGIFCAEFREEKDAQDYIKFKNNQSVQKAKIEAIIEYAKTWEMNRISDTMLIKMLNELKDN